jgi:hypothetical protein
VPFALLVLFSALWPKPVMSFFKSPNKFSTAECG